MRRIVNALLIIFATVVTVAVLFALSNILQNLWGQTVVIATPLEAEDASNTFKESAIGFAFMALPFLGMMWGLTVALVRRR
jgi:hypothetical protein